MNNTENEHNPENERQNISYTQLIWEDFARQFENWIGLFLSLALFFIMFIVPLISSRYPFYWKQGDTVQYPWFVDFVNPAHPLDWYYNMSALSLVLTLIGLYIISLFFRNKSRSWFFQWGTITFLIMFVFTGGFFSVVEFKRGDLSQTDFKELYEKQPNEIQAIFPLYPYSHTSTNIDQMYLSPLQYPVPDSLRKQILEENPKLQKLSEDQQYEKIVQTDSFAQYRKQHPHTMTIHWLGTDEVGGDILARVMYGTRASLAVGFIATILSILIGMILGAFAGYFGGFIDMLISRSLEVVIMFPRIMLIIAILASVRYSDNVLIYIALVLGMIGWPGTCRLIRNTCLQTREEEYITAARSLGGGNLRIIFKHVLPNSMSPLFVNAPFGIAGGILLEGGLGMIGFTGNYPSWGKILNQGQETFPDEAIHLVLVPVVCIFIAITAYNLIGAGLRDAVDPKMRVEG